MDNFLRITKSRDFKFFITVKKEDIENFFGTAVTGLSLFFNIRTGENGSLVYQKKGNFEGTDEDGMSIFSVDIASDDTENIQPDDYCYDVCLCLIEGEKIKLNYNIIDWSRVVVSPCAATNTEILNFNGG